MINAKTALMLATKRQAKLDDKLDKKLVKKHLTKINSRIKNNKYGEKTMRHHIPMMDDADSVVIIIVNTLKNKGYNVSVMEAFFDGKDNFLFNHDERMSYPRPKEDEYVHTGVTIDISWGL